MRELNEAEQFVLEIASLVALGYWGWHIEAPVAVRAVTAHPTSETGARD